MTLPSEQLDENGLELNRVLNSTTFSHAQALRKLLHTWGRSRWLEKAPD